MEDMPTTNSPHLINPTATAATAATLGQNKDISDMRVNKRERSKQIKNKNQKKKKNKNNINLNEVIIVHEEEEEDEDEDEDEDEYGNNNKEEENENEKEKEEVERKIEALQRIVPGGESLGVDRLFEETAGYIMALQSQLKTMKALASFFEDLDKHKRMFGG